MKRFPEISFLLEVNFWGRANKPIFCALPFTSRILKNHQFYKKIMSKSRASLQNNQFYKVGSLKPSIFHVGSSKPSILRVGSARTIATLQKKFSNRICKIINFTKRVSSKPSYLKVWYSKAINLAIKHLKNYQL